MGSKQLGSKFLQRSQICSHTPSALNAGAKRSGATCHMAMPQCCYLAKGAKRPSHTTNTQKFDRIPFDPCNSIKRFNLCPFDQKNSTYLQPPGSSSSIKCHVYHHVGGRRLPVTWLNTIWLNFFRRVIWLKNFEPSDHKIKPTPFQLKEYVNTRKYHNVGHMRCMHARPHRLKDQLPLRSLRDLRSR